MNSKAPRAPVAAGNRSWLDDLPAKAASAAAAARAALPTTAGAAGPDLPAVLAAWILIDPAQAAQLVEEWLATADAAGNLTPPCPVVCQLAERTAEALADPDGFAARILPPLAKVLAREFDRYDERGTGLPRWPTAAEALVPAEFAPGRFTVDLAVLLSNEAAAFLRLADSRADLARALDIAEGEQRELDDWLKATFWDEETSTFHRHDEGRTSVPDRSPCGFFPLIWEGRTEAMATGLRARAPELRAAAWPPRAWIAFFALLLNAPHNSVVAQMRREGLPPGASPAETAAWTLLALGSDAARAGYLEAIPPAARWLDGNGRRLARAAFAGGAALLAALLAWSVGHREKNEAFGDWERRARLACEDGEHARAAALYGQAAQRGETAYFRYRQAGEWLHLAEYAAAEAAYREILASRPDAPNARMNLALAVLKQGRRAEARDLYRAVAEAADAAALPDLAARARLAAELVERQLALDRE